MDVRDIENLTDASREVLITTIWALWRDNNRLRGDVAERDKWLAVYIKELAGWRHFGIEWRKFVGQFFIEHSILPTKTDNAIPSYDKLVVWWKELCREALKYSHKLQLPKRRLRRKGKTI